jgi:hypothetical protein
MFYGQRLPFVTVSHAGINILSWELHCVFPLKIPHEPKNKRAIVISHDYERSTPDYKGTVSYSNLLNPSKPKLVLTTVKNPVLTAKKTTLRIITKINRLTLFKEEIAIYTENIKSINTKYK